MGFRWREAKERVRAHDKYPFPQRLRGSDYMVSTLKNTNNDNNNKRSGHALRGGALASSTVRGGVWGVQSLSSPHVRTHTADIIF